MAEQRTSIECVVFDNSRAARAHGPGGIWYTWTNYQRAQFAEDVASVFIIVPVVWEGREGFTCEWTVSRKNHCGAQWRLSGTREKPTLSPSLHWRGFWHGWLRDGFLQSV